MDYTEIQGDDGRVWRVKFTLRALGWFEKQSGIKIMELEEVKVADWWLDDIALLLAAGLYHEDPDVTKDEGYEILESLDPEQVSEQIFQALRRDQGVDLPAETDAQTGNQNGASKKKSRGTGTKQKQAPQRSA